MTEAPEPSFVVVLTTPSGQRMLSSTSLMTREEAEHEARSWRKTQASAMWKWTADVREVPLEP